MEKRGPFSVLLLLSLVQVANGGSIHGTVSSQRAVVGAPDALRPYAGRTTALTQVPKTSRGEMKHAVIYVEALSPEVAERLPARTDTARLVQQHQMFVPRVLPVAAGTTVDFPNRDPIYHNVFSLSPTKRFDLGKYPKGNSRQVRFERTGLVRVYCDIHSNMEAFVLVLPHRAFAQPDDEGAFRLPDLPGGTYTLVGWHPDFGEIREEIEVPGDGDVQIHLTF